MLAFLLSSSLLLLPFCLCILCVDGVVAAIVVHFLLQVNQNSAYFLLLSSSAASISSIFERNGP